MSGLFNNIQYIFDQDDQRDQRKNQQGFLNLSQNKGPKYNKDRIEELYKDDQKRRDKLDLIREEQELAKRYQQLNQLENRINLSNVSKLLTEDRSIKDFYQYNQDWQNLKEKKLKSQRQEEEQNSSIMPTKFTSMNLTQNSIELKNYVGPIKGWQERFQQYVNSQVHQSQKDISKEQKYSQNTKVNQFLKAFQPTLNKNSINIAQRNDNTPVQQRLLKYGEITRQQRELMKDHVKQYSNAFQIQFPIYPKFDILEIVNQQDRKQFQPQLRKNYYDRLLENRDPVFDRLYKFADEKTQKQEKGDLNQQNDLCFKPQLHKTPIDIEMKVNQQKRPLYENPKEIEKRKEQEKQQKQEEQGIEEETKKSFDVERFQEFLKRSYSIFARRLVHDENIEKEKDKRQLEQCSFAPLLNKKSMNIINQKQSESFENLDIYDRFANKIGLQSVEQTEWKKHIKPKEKDNNKVNIIGDADIQNYVSSSTYQHILLDYKEKKNSVHGDLFDNIQLKQEEIEYDPDLQRQVSWGKVQQKDPVQLLTESQWKLSHVLNSSVNLSSSKSPKKSSQNSQKSSASQTSFKGKYGNFMAQLLNSEFAKGNFNLESILNNSPHLNKYRDSPIKTKKYSEIVSEFEIVEKEIQVIMSEKERQQNILIIQNQSLINNSNLRDNSKQNNNNNYGMNNSNIVNQLVGNTSPSPNPNSRQSQSQSYNQRGGKILGLTEEQISNNGNSTINNNSSNSNSFQNQKSNNQRDSILNSQNNNNNVSLGSINKNLVKVIEDS